MGLTFLQHIKTASHALPVPVLGIPQQLVSSLTIWVGPPVRVAHEVRQCIFLTFPLCGFDHISCWFPRNAT